MTSLAASLFAVFLAAKAIVLAGRTMPDPAIASILLLWQDVAVVLGVALLERFARLRWPVRAIYIALVLFAIVNVPVIRALSSPVTMQMLRATGGALSDSLMHYVNVTNVASIVSLLALAIGLPFVRADVWPAWTRAGRAWAIAGGTLVAGGWVMTPRIDTHGLERNAAFALASTALPRVSARDEVRDWRASSDSAATTDLSSLRSVAAGKNVLLVVLESAGARYLRTYGSELDPMPAVTALASRSVVFENAYAVYPESVKGMVATFASQYPAFDAGAADHAPLMSSSIAHALRSAGYATGLFHSGRFMYLGMEELIANSGFTTMEDAGVIGGNRNSSFGIDEPAAVRRVLQWIDSVPRAKPFFAAYLPVAGHHPYAHETSGGFDESTDKGRYLNALHEGDRALGELLEGLHLRGLDASTVIVVVGDHGEAFGQHEGNYGHTLEIYDENIRVPLMFAIPGVSARRVPNVASLLDLAPTILGLVDAEVPGAFQGESLLDSRPRAALFFTDYSLGLLGLRDGCTKYVYEIQSRRSRTFDICADPAETQVIGNVAYQERLTAWVSAQKARLVNP